MDIHKRLEQLEFVHRTADVASWVWDIAGDSVQWFGDPEGLLGLEPGSHSGRFCQYLSLLHPEDVPAARRTFVECLRGERPTYRTEERVAGARRRRALAGNLWSGRICTRRPRHADGGRGARRDGAASLRGPHPRARRSAGGARARAHHAARERQPRTGRVQHDGLARPARAGADGAPVRADAAGGLRGGAVGEDAATSPGASSAARCA